MCCVFSAGHAHEQAHAHNERTRDRETERCWMLCGVVSQTDRRSAHHQAQPHLVYTVASALALSAGWPGIGGCVCVCVFLRDDEGCAVPQAHPPIHRVCWARCTCPTAHPGGVCTRSLNIHTCKEEKNALRSGISTRKHTITPGSNSFGCLLGPPMFVSLERGCAATATTLCFALLFAHLDMLLYLQLRQRLSLIVGSDNERVGSQPCV